MSWGKPSEGVMAATPFFLSTLTTFRFSGNEQHLGIQGDKFSIRKRSILGLDLRGIHASKPK
jgi:hypothetical protein